MRKLLIFTPINPLRPYSEYLNQLHTVNVNENISNCPTKYSVKYVTEQCVLAHEKQQHGLYRGQNVVRVLNEIYEKYKDKFEYICKWDDDILLPVNTIKDTLNILENGDAIGAGLFSTQYGAPRILMVDPETIGWTNNFQRFYIYRMNVWGHIETPEPRGDPDQVYQIGLEGKKIQLHIPHVHLDHRACDGNDDLYRVLLDMATWMYYL